MPTEAEVIGFNNFICWTLNDCGINTAHQSFLGSIIREVGECDRVTFTTIEPCVSLWVLTPMCSRPANADRSNTAKPSRVVIRKERRAFVSTNRGAM